MGKIQDLLPPQALCVDLQLDLGHTVAASERDVFRNLLHRLRRSENPLLRLEQEHPDAAPTNHKVTWYLPFEHPQYKTEKVAY